MTKQYFTALAAYNSWANDKAMDWLSQISDEQWEKEQVSSFGSLRQTAVHIASAEKIWVDFWTKAPTPTIFLLIFEGSKNELIDIWKTTSAGMHNFIKLPGRKFYRCRDLRLSPGWIRAVVLLANFCT